MARLSLNKSSLTRQKRQLNSYEQFLPSLLDVKPDQPALGLLIQRVGPPAEDATDN